MVVCHLCGDMSPLLIPPASGTRMFLSSSRVELRDTKARCEKDFSLEKVPAVLGGEAVLWDLGLQGPPEGRR